MHAGMSNGGAEPVEKDTRSKREAARFGLALKRLSELKRLFRYREQLGLVTDANDADIANVFADVIGCVENYCPPSQPSAPLDFASMTMALRTGGITIGENTVMAAVHRTAEIIEKKADKYRPMGAAPAGRLVGLTMEERRELKIVTMKAVDETDEERAMYVAERRRGRDRDRKSLKRREAGRLRRDAYERQSLERNRPWKALGISRSTYYRRRQSRDVSIK